MLPAAPPLPVRAAYARWAAAYPPHAHNPLMQAEEAALLALLPPSLRGCRCLDLACGSGRYSQHLHRRGAAAVVGLDLSPEMLAVAETSSERLQSLFWPLPLRDNLFEVVVCGLAVGHSPILEPLLAEAARVLTPGGLLLYSDIHPQGTEQGWQRTFTVGGQRRAVAHHLHRYGDHWRGCRRAGLRLLAVCQPGLWVAGRRQRVALVLAARKVN